MGSVAKDLVLNLATRPPCLVLDPWLCLDARGLCLVQRLHGSAELWMVRELWNILDNSNYFALHPAALLGSGMDEPRASMTNIAQTLETWDRLRTSTDLAGLRLFWLGDGLRESLLPSSLPGSAHAVFERLAIGLDLQSQPKAPLECGYRDAAALAATFSGAPILTRVEDNGQEPYICRWLKASGLRVSKVADDWMQLERTAWRNRMIEAQCAPLFWCGLHLSLVHLTMPDVASELASQTWLDSESGCASETDEGASWRGGQVYWYAL